MAKKNKQNKKAVDKAKETTQKLNDMIKKKEAKVFAEKDGSVYIETSAKTGVNVDKAFIDLTNIMVENSQKKQG